MRSVSALEVFSVAYSLSRIRIRCECQHGSIFARFLDGLHDCWNGGKRTFAMHQCLQNRDSGGQMPASSSVVHSIQKALLLPKRQQKLWAPAPVVMQTYHYVAVKGQVILAGSPQGDIKRQEL